MNFLAHVYLSQHPPELMVGNFIGDFIKGKAYEDLPAVMAKGVILHREIDAYTDTNKWVKQSKQRLVPKYRHYSAVVVDMFYDHLLASNWKTYHHEPLEKFAARCYAVLNDHFNLLPEKAQYMLPYMIRDNWFCSYAEITGISQALKGLSRRTRFISNMEHATNELEKHYDEFAAEFKNFFPSIISFTEKWRNDNV